MSTYTAAREITPALNAGAAEAHGAAVAVPNVML